MVLVYKLGVVPRYEPLSGSFSPFLETSFRLTHIRYRLRDYQNRKDYKDVLTTLVLAPRIGLTFMNKKGHTWDFLYNYNFALGEDAPRTGLLGLRYIHSITVKEK